MFIKYAHIYTKDRLKHKNIMAAFIMLAMYNDFNLVIYLG